MRFTLHLMVLFVTLQCTALVEARTYLVSEDAHSIQKRDAARSRHYYNSGYSSNYNRPQQNSGGGNGILGLLTNPFVLAFKGALFGTLAANAIQNGK